MCPRNWTSSASLSLSLLLMLMLGLSPASTSGQTAPTSQGASDPEEPTRRALTAPMDGIFPGSDYLGPTPLIGVPDTDPVYPLTKALWTIAPALKDAKIKVYGWINPGISVSTSNKSNIPESYAIVPNRVELDQGVLRIERLPDTVQTISIGAFVSPPYMESTTAGLRRKAGSADNS